MHMFELYADETRRNRADTCESAFARQTEFEQLEFAPARVACRAEITKREQSAEELWYIFLAELFIATRNQLAHRKFRRSLYDRRFASGSFPSAESVPINFSRWLVLTRTRKYRNSTVCFWTISLRKQAIVLINWRDRPRARNKRNSPTISRDQYIDHALR